MPCTYYTPGELEAMRREALDRATRLLCKMVAHFGIIPGDPELEAWKAEHDERDRKRKEAEEVEAARVAREARRADIIAKAASKLTPEEWDAIGGKR